MPEDASPGGRTPLRPECGQSSPARDILALRGPVRALSPRKLRTLLGRVSNLDLAVLVCTPPLDRGLLEFLGQGLAPAALAMLRRDCERWTGAEPAHLDEAVRALGQGLEAARGVDDPPAPRRSLLARLAGWWSGLARPRPAPEPEPRDFSLFSATPGRFAAFWLPWRAEVRRRGLAGMDWGRLAERCDPCTAAALRRAGQWRAPGDAARAVAEARAAFLPLWRGHIRLAGLLGEALLREDDPRALAETLARDVVPGPSADSLMDRARQRLAAYDERLPGPTDSTGFFKDLGLENAESLFRGPSKAPFALSPCAPLPEQAAEVLAIRLACRREGFLFIEEAARTSGDSALAPAAEVVLAVDGNDQEHLALALDACRTRAEAAFGLLETVLEALAFSSPRRFARTLKALAGPERT